MNKFYFKTLFASKYFQISSGYANTKEEAKDIVLRGLTINHRKSDILHIQDFCSVTERDYSVEHYYENENSLYMTSSYCIHSGFQILNLLGELNTLYIHPFDVRTLREPPLYVWEPHHIPLEDGHDIFLSQYFFEVGFSYNGNNSFCIFAIDPANHLKMVMDK